MKVSAVGILSIFVTVCFLAGQICQANQLEFVAQGDASFYEVEHATVPRLSNFALHFSDSKFVSRAKVPAVILQAQASKQRQLQMRMEQSLQTPIVWLPQLYLDGRLVNLVESVLFEAQQQVQLYMPLAYIVLYRLSMSNTDEYPAIFSLN